MEGREEKLKVKVCLVGRKVKKIKSCVFGMRKGNERKWEKREWKIESKIDVVVFCLKIKNG